jgi:hypothetical protein
MFIAVVREVFNPVQQVQTQEMAHMPTQPQDSERVTLRGGLPGTATFLYIGADGSLIVELYDYSPQAEEHFGNEVAFLLHVAPEHKAQMLALLRDPAATHGDGGDAELLALLCGRFRDYHGVQRWFDANDILYQKTFDSRA